MGELLTNCQRLKHPCGPIAARARSTIARHIEGELDDLECKKTPRCRTLPAPSSAVNPILSSLAHYLCWLLTSAPLGAAPGPQTASTSRTGVLLEYADDVRQLEYSTAGV